MEEGLLGREAEIDALEAFLEHAAKSFAALVLEGEPGIGKSTVWREGVRRARLSGFTVLVCRPAQAESKLSFSALSDLLEKVPAEAFTPLPEPQRRALEAALLQTTTGESVEPRAVAAGLRGVLTGLAAMDPVLVAIDDTQWLDPASAAALEFALRRIEDERIGLFAARRPTTGGGRVRLELREPELLELGGLSLAAIHGLLKRRLGRSLQRPLLVRVHDAAGGNPFFCLEIARVATEADIGTAEPLPVPPDLSDLVLRRVRRLRASTRDVLLAVAVAARPTESLLAGAFGVEASVEAVEEAEEAGLLELRAGAMRFAHPLYAAAVHSSATEARRRRVHRELGGLVGDEEQRARHLALASEGPDESLASLLADASAAAGRRGALEAAAELMELAVRATPDDSYEAALERRFDLGSLLRLIGDTRRAREVVEDIVATSSGRLQCRALVELAGIVYWTEGPVPAVDCCERALRVGRGAPVLQGRAHADLAVYCDFDLERSYRHACAAVELIEEHGAVDAHAYPEALSVAARGSLMLGRGLPLAELDRAIEVEARALEAEPSRSVIGRITTASGQWLKYVDDFDGARARLEQARRQAIEEGDDSSLPSVLMHLAQTELWSGNWPSATRYADESCDLAESLGQSPLAPAAHRAMVDAHVGHSERARSTAEQALDFVEQNPLVAPLHLRVLGFLYLSEGDVRQAERHLSSALQRMYEIQILEPGVLRIHADAVEALVGIGDLELAEEVLVPWEEQGRRIELAWSQATSARCRALLEAARGEMEAAFASVERALEHHDRLAMPFELGRTVLVKGQIERRAKHKAAAKTSLEHALAIFDELGAPLWAARTRAELQRIGLRRTAGDELTEGERRVAEFAASGLTNREVAAKLFMSPKTVEANLARAYRKLGIHSRAELGARLATEEREPTEA